MQEQEKPATLLERYGRAILQMEQWKWDDVIGPKPDGFDDLPIKQKVEIIKPYLQEVRTIIGPVVEDYYRHMIDFKATEEEWLEYRKYCCEKEIREEEYQLFLAQQIESAHCRINQISGDSSFSLLNLSYILLGLAIGLYLV